jgi:hypothetical protein
MRRVEVIPGDLAELAPPHGVTPQQDKGDGEPEQADGKRLAQPDYSFNELMIPVHGALLYF